MNGLLDTHTFLWWINDDERLSANARAFIEDSSNKLFFSSASAWEISIKAQLGKLKFPDNAEAFLVEQLAKNDFESLTISIKHAISTGSLPLLHRDPFDRMLVTQSMVESMPLLTEDELIIQYGVKTIW